MKATHRPSAEIAGSRLVAYSVPLPRAVSPFDPTDTRSVIPSSRSRTKMSLFVEVSLGTRPAASEWNATKRPSAEIAGRTKQDQLTTCSSAEDTETRSMAPFELSWTNTSQESFVSPSTRFDAYETNAV